jgi:hypothetical protein
MQYQIKLNPVAYVEAVAIAIVAVTLPLIAIVGTLVR